MNSEKLKKQYATLHYWWDGLHTSMWNNLSQFTTEEEKVIKRETEDLLWEIRSKLEKVYAPRIGKAVISEIRTKE